MSILKKKEEVIDVEKTIEYRLKENAPIKNSFAWVYVKDGFVEMIYPQETKIRIEAFRRFLEDILQMIKEIESGYTGIHVVHKNPYAEYRKKLKDPMYLKEFKVKLDRFVHLLTKHTRIINKLTREIKQSVEDVEKIRKELVLQDEQLKQTEETKPEVIQSEVEKSN